MQFSPSQADRLIEIAGQAIRCSLSGTILPALTDADPVLLQPAGCFVSLHDQQTHLLRGCMGRMETDLPLAVVVQQTAVNTLSDPRFEETRVRLEELPNLEMELSVLSPLVLAADVLDFDPMNDGIYLTIDGRSGCFLPQVARQTGWSREQLLDRLCTEKLGLAARSWKSGGAGLQKFRVVIVGPQPFERAVGGTVRI